MNMCLQKQVPKIEIVLTHISCMKNRLFILLFKMQLLYLALQLQKLLLIVLTLGFHLFIK